ncbi:VWA domain-containing protein [Roseomonas sp. BN140053]|uniref:VWA domain-containing protein n=1 Tax=Roseomonas sp. BN140053 TaxID=3391898 RepID=UPI0039E95EFB
MAKPLVPATPTGAVAAFLDRARAVPALRTAATRARLLFAVDATASRQPAWDRACAVQGEMFLAVRDLGGLAVSLSYYRGFGEFTATPFLEDGAELARRMSGVSCLGGRTQIGRVLDHALREAARARLGAVVFVGDAVEEAPDALCHAAGQLGARGVPVFVFQDGADRLATEVLRQIARLSGGAWAPFDSRSPRALAELLRAAAVFAAGGGAALARLPGPAASAIAGQLAAPRGG